MPSAVVVPRPTDVAPPKSTQQDLDMDALPPRPSARVAYTRMFPRASYSALA